MAIDDRFVALVPMRDQSERVVGKNYRPFDGRPLYHWIIRTLLACPRIRTVAIDTDSPTITADAAREFPDVRLIARPAHLTAGTVPMNDVIAHDLSILDGEYFLQTHSTNPLLRPQTIERAIDTLLANRGANDSLFSVTPLHTRLWRANGMPVNHDPAVLMRTQDLLPVFEENSCLYLFGRATFANRGRIGIDPFLFPIERREAIDIDEEIDFQMAEQLHRLEREALAGGPR